MGESATVIYKEKGKERQAKGPSGNHVHTWEHRCDNNWVKQAKFLSFSFSPFPKHPLSDFRLYMLRCSVPAEYTLQPVATASLGFQLDKHTCEGSTKDKNAQNKTVLLQQANKTNPTAGS